MAMKTKPRQTSARIRAAGVDLAADLNWPEEPIQGLVVFAHGSGSSRLSPRNRAVASELVGRGLATVLLDLLTREEELVDDRDGRYRFDIELLTSRFVDAVDWLRAHELPAGLPVGLFGASTGAAVALQAAASRPQQVQAVVSRGGRPDLTGKALEKVAAPTLLIVGERDTEVLALNRRAALGMHAPVKIAVVPGATHLFEEPGCLEEVTRLAGNWFLEHLTQSRGGST